MKELSSRVTGIRVRGFGRKICFCRSILVHLCSICVNEDRVSVGLGHLASRANLQVKGGACECDKGALEDRFGYLGYSKLSSGQEQFKLHWVGVCACVCHCENLLTPP